MPNSLRPVVYSALISSAFSAAAPAGDSPTSVMLATWATTLPASSAIGAPLDAAIRRGRLRLGNAEIFPRDEAGKLRPAA